MLAHFVRFAVSPARYARSISTVQSRDDTVPYCRAAKRARSASGFVLINVCTNQTAHMGGQQYKRTMLYGFRHFCHFFRTVWDPTTDFTV